MLGDPADVILPVALAQKDGPWARQLWRYKSDLRPAGARRLLADILAGFLARHEPCLAAAAGTGRFDVITVVPSSRRRDQSEGTLATLVAEAAGDRTRRWPPPVSGGQAVLLVDDTWTTGWHAQLAAAALKRAGAECVAVLVLGRHVRRLPPGRPPFSLEVCTAPCRRAARPTADSPRPD